MRIESLDSDFLQLLIDPTYTVGTRLPTLSEMSGELDVSVGKLREQINVARVLGLVSVKPKVGIRREPYAFAETIRPSILFGLASGEATFEQFSTLRQAIEVSFWECAVHGLQASDITSLQTLVAQAWQRLRATRIEIPHTQHRALHLTIFSRLDNPFVTGILETYWDVYEAYEFDRYQSYAYWEEVWHFHEQIVDAVARRDSATGRQRLIEHFNLLKTTIDTVNKEHAEAPPNGQATDLPTHS